MAPIPLLIVFGVAVAGIISHKLILGGVETPDLDFGSGSSQGSMFDFIAGRYDTINRILAFRLDVGWRKIMVNKLQQDLERRGIEYPQILDVATGTADVAIMTSKYIPQAYIVGVDPSHGMLNVGRKKITKRHLDDKIRLEWADARQFSKQYPDNSFDAGTIAFGIRNIPERDVALCEIHHLLKPDSLTCILEFSDTSATSKEGGLLAKAAHLFIGHVVPFVGGVLSGQPKMYKHLQNSIQNFPSPEQFKAQIEGLHCSSSTSGGGSEPSYVVEEIQHLNFGTVQIYSLRSIKPEDAGPATATAETQENTINRAESEAA